MFILHIVFHTSMKLKDSNRKIHLRMHPYTHAWCFEIV